MRYVRGAMVLVWRRLSVAAGVCALAAATVEAQTKVPTRALAKPVAELEDALSGAFDVRELSDGRLIVLDVKDNLLQLVGATFDGMKAIGREGSGPAEYRRVTQLLPRRGDTTLAYDVMNARFLVIDSKGVPVNTISLREASGGMPVGPMAVRGYDAGGRLLFQGMKVTMGPNGPALSDTAPVLRLDPAKKQIDTLGLVRIGSPGMKMSGDMQKGSGALRVVMPAYPVVDEWGLLPDGRVVVVRGADYHMEFIGGAAAAVVKPPIPYDRVKVTTRDKAKMREAAALAQKEMTKAVAGARASLPAGSTPAQMPKMAVDEPTEWPAYKPAFGQTALKVAPDGELWVARLLSADDERSAYDVFTRDGALRMRVMLPVKTKLVGIGAKHLYAVRSDADELQYLQKYVRP